jgi:midasin (ATPase involved in ribosome maturation)
MRKSLLISAHDFNVKEMGRMRARRFEWVDGPLTRAVAGGGWVLLDGANLCPATVLDRLNPLLEPGGELLLNEAGGGADGAPRALRPHAAFRLILALDPRCAAQPCRLIWTRCMGLPGGRCPFHSKVLQPGLLHTLLWEQGGSYLAA